MSFQYNFRQLTYHIWLHVFVLVSIMMMGRIVMFFTFVDSITLLGKEEDIFRMLTIGLRYDLRVATMGLVPIYLMGIVMASQSSWWQVFRRMMPYYCAVLSTRRL